MFSASTGNPVSFEKLGLGDHSHVQNKRREVRRRFLEAEFNLSHTKKEVEI
jgi:hypothetical protein